MARRDRAAQERAQFADHMVNKVAGDVAEGGNGTPSALLLRYNGATGVSLKARQSPTAIKTAETRPPQNDTVAAEPAAPARRLPRGERR